MTAARHFWNASIPLVSQPIERELLKEPLKIILECIAATADKEKKEVWVFCSSIYINSKCNECC